MSYPRIFATPGVGDFAEAVDTERQAQIKKWGDQQHDDGTGRPGDRENADRYRSICKANGPLQDNWRDIAMEEVAEAFAETDPDKLEEELIQASAVFQAWIYDIRRRRAAQYAAARAISA